MTDHPITPPPELVQEWGHDANLSGVPHNDEHWAYEQHIATCAAQWGADQELEACIEWLKEMELVGEGDVSFLRDDRRPKPPSLKEQALALIDSCNDPDNDYLDDEAMATIRRALEAL